MEKLKWWAYWHTNGSLQIKRYFGPRDIEEAWESPFVYDVAGPFEADNRYEAEKYITDQFIKPPRLEPKIKS